MWKRYGFVLGCFVLATGTPKLTRAIPVEYRISGLLSGDASVVFSPLSLVDAPFEVSIVADTNTSSLFGNIAGYGPAYVNESVHTTWTVEGLGTATSDHVQIASLPGVAHIGFSWNGDAFGGSTVAETFWFLNGAFASDPSYGYLNAVVPSIPVTLVTQLQNPPGIVPPYTTSIDFPNQGRSLTLTNLKSLSYEVIAIPEPSTVALLGLGLLGLAGWRRARA